VGPAAAGADRSRAGETSYLLILDEPLQGLDPLNRQLVRRFVDVLIGEGETQLLFVSHHAEDAPDCITHRLEFVPDGEVTLSSQQNRLTWQGPALPFSDNLHQYNLSL
jgi:ABC-type multidrug transport system ATPase subunit